MPHHASKVQLRNPRVQALEARCLSQLNSALFNSIGNSRDHGVVRDLAIVCVSLVDATSIGSDEILFQQP